MPETLLSETIYAVTVRVPAAQAAKVTDAFHAALTALGLPTDTLTAQAAEPDRPTADDILALARQALTEAGIDPALVTRLRFENSEWDNGYFFVDTPAISFHDENDAIDLNVDVDDIEMKAVTSALYDFHGGPLGRSDYAIIDLVNNTIDV